MNSSIKNKIVPFFKKKIKKDNYWDPIGKVKFGLIKRSFLLGIKKFNSRFKKERKKRLTKWEFFLMWFWPLSILFVGIILFLEEVFGIKTNSSIGLLTLFLILLLILKSLFLIYELILWIISNLRHSLDPTFNLHDLDFEDEIKFAFCNLKNYLYYPNNRSVSENNKFRKKFNSFFGDSYYSPTDFKLFKNIFGFKNSNGIKYNFYSANYLINREILVNNSNFISFIFLNFLLKKKSYGDEKIFNDGEFFVLKLNKKLKTSFVLSNQDFINSFSEKEINLESKKFNDEFSFSYAGYKKDMVLEITKILTPKVQEKLIQLKKINSSVRILFNENELIFDLPFQKDIYDFSKRIPDKKITLNEKQNFFLLYEEISEIAVDIAKYLD